MPSLISYTDLIKPITQLIGHIPQLLSCIYRRSTTCISIVGEHLHFIGSVFGFLMLVITQNFNLSRWILYGNTFFQAISIYLVAAWLGEFRLLDEVHETQKIPNDHQPLLREIDHIASL